MAAQAQVLEAMKKSDRVNEPREANSKPRQARGARPGALLTALSVEFVAKPRDGERIHRGIPDTITNALGGVSGFSGCLVMISDQESRLVSVVTFWSGDDRSIYCGKSARWIKKLLAPFIDHCLRVRTFDAYLPVLPAGSEIGEARGSAPGAAAMPACVAVVQNFERESVPDAFSDRDAE
jgi:hypothetical protein